MFDIRNVAQSEQVDESKMAEPIRKTRGQFHGALAAATLRCFLLHLHAFQTIILYFRVLRRLLSRVMIVNQRIS